MRTEPFWLASAPPFAADAGEGVPAKADVVVVGGGFTGLSAALELARKGRDVVVLEAGRVIGEASGRNGGHCNTGVSQSFHALVDQVGPDVASTYYRAFASAVDHVADVVEREGIHCHFVRTGKLKLASKPGHFPGLVKTYAALRLYVDQDVELLERGDLAREVGSDAFHGGLLQRRGAQMHMGMFGVGLAQAAVRAGARIHQNTPVTGLNPLGGTRYRVTTPGGTIHADQVLLATGCSHHGPFEWLQRRIVPVGSFVVVTSPLPASLIAQMLPARRTYVTSRVIGNYFRLTHDDRLVWGGRARFARSSPESDAKSGAVLLRQMRSLFPGLRDVQIDYRWGGMVDMSQDRLPRAGQHDGLYYSLGYSGHGTQMSVYMGSVMARRMTGGVLGNPWERGTWPAVPGNALKSRLLPVVGMYYKVKDRLY